MADFNYEGTESDNFIDYSSNYIQLYGAAGHDDLGTSFAGHVVLEGGDGNDLLYTLWSGNASFGDFYGGNGNDWIQGGATNTGESIYGGAGDDFVEQNNDTGKGGDDYIDGGQGRDALHGEVGNDSIFGGEGDDSGAAITAGPPGNSATAAPGLFGGVGDDYLDGGRGNDLLVGGLGFDTYVGGPGNDIFDFDTTAESPKGSLRDLILDFKKGDRIDLSDIGSDLDFIGKKGFHKEDGEVRFKKGIVQVDTDGNGKADFEIKLDGVTKLKDADLLL